MVPEELQSPVNLAPLRVTASRFPKWEMLVRRRVSSNFMEKNMNVTENRHHEYLQNCSTFADGILRRCPTSPSHAASTDLEPTKESRGAMGLEALRPTLGYHAR
jgi:hypothetical protein